MYISSSISGTVYMLVAFRFSFVVFFTIYLCFENEMPTIKEFESLLDSKLQPIQAKLDDLVKQMNDNYTEWNWWEI